MNRAFNEFLRKVARCQTCLAADLMPDTEKAEVQERLDHLERQARYLESVFAVRKQDRGEPPTRWHWHYTPLEDDTAAGRLLSASYDYDYE
jgi:hypothetical protein